MGLSNYCLKAFFSPGCPFSGTQATLGRLLLGMFCPCLSSTHSGTMHEAKGKPREHTARSLHGSSAPGQSVLFFSTFRVTFCLFYIQCQRFQYTWWEDHLIHPFLILNAINFFHYKYYLARKLNLGFHLFYQNVT